MIEDLQEQLKAEAKENERHSEEMKRSQATMRPKASKPTTQKKR